MYTYNDAGADSELSDGCVTDQVLNYLDLFRLQTVMYISLRPAIWTHVYI